MTIRCVPRTYFERIKGTPEERRILETHKVISIQSSSGSDTEPPFSPECLASPRLLCLTFDDVLITSQDLADKCDVVLFDHKMARQIVKFAGGGRWPLIVHCTEGISRSGAVGSVLDYYCNCQWSNLPEDHVDFIRENPDISPNPNVERILTDVIEGDMGHEF